MQKIDDIKFDKRLTLISSTLIFISIVLLNIILVFKLLSDINNFNNTADYIYLTLSLISLVLLVTSVLGLVTLYKRKKNNK